MGIWNQNKDIRKNNNVVLAGHNIKKVFGPLHQIPLKQHIKVYFKDSIFVYEIILKKRIDVIETEYLKESTHREITLITCVEDKNKRLLVKGKFLREKSILPKTRF